MGVRLLADLSYLFTMRAPDGTPLLGADGRPQFYPALFTDSILSGLYAMPEAPWSSYYGRQISARDLSSLLTAFDVESQNVCIGGTVRKGYRTDDLWDAWQRYV